MSYQVKKCQLSVCGAWQMEASPCISPWRQSVLLLVSQASYSFHPYTFSFFCSTAEINTLDVSGFLRQDPFSCTISGGTPGHAHHPFLGCCNDLSLLAGPWLKPVILDMFLLRAHLTSVVSVSRFWFLADSSGFCLWKRKDRPLLTIDSCPNNKATELGRIFHWLFQPLCAKLPQHRFRIAD